MKKLLIAILTCITALCAIGLTACGSSSNWVKPTLTNGGNVISLNGFIAETDNYLYFINGVADYSSDNTFGAPVKGSLMAVDKSTVGTDNLKQEVIVPKLFVAKDYNSGLFIKDGYVYYGTACDDKGIDGNVAFNTMTFMKSSLDGKTTEEYVTVPALTYKYDFFVANGVVYIVYFNESDAELICYNTADKSSTVIAKNDATVDVANDKGEYLSLNASDIMFTDDGVYFTETVYTDPYSEEQAENANYGRTTAKYNVLSLYTVAGGVEVIANGSEKSLTYDLLYNKGGYVFYTATDIYAKATTYAYDGETTTEIKNAANLNDNALVISLDEVYFIDTNELVLYKSTLVENEKEIRQKVAYSDDISVPLFINGEYLYYFDVDQKISRISLVDASTKKQTVSDSVVDTAYYTPVILNVNETEYLFYIDSSMVGSSYINYVDINSEVVEEDADEDGEIDTYYLDGAKVLGTMLNVDIANEIKYAISQIGATLTLEGEGELVDENVVNARKVYDEMIAENPALKEYITDEEIAKLENAETAVELANAYNKLKANFANLNSNQKEEYKLNTTNIENLKKANELRQKLFDLGDNGATYIAVRTFIPDQYNYYYQEASKLIPLA